ncbi:MAG: metallophosphoesterase family protein [Deltaproteobacteria bacterium]|nr:metallophosphoesterase family protein [Deltaproteobacteria bacterium]MBW2128436.1 metallophosphoesterase family protein [Deltaproteobacteria bacterium]
MKIGVISDTHLRKVTDAFRHLLERYFSDADVILHAGDFVSPEIVSFLSEWEFHGVHGNMDPPEIKQSLPSKKVLELEGVKIGLIHGWGAPEDLEERIWGEFGAVDVIVYGHSHRSANHLRGGTLFFNPGTAMGYALTGIHSVGILTVEDGIRGEIIDIETSGLSR